MSNRPIALAAQAMPSGNPLTIEERLAEFDEFRRDAVRLEAISDSLDETLARRVTALEEVLAARGPARLLAAWRLGRAIRASIAPFPGPSFWWRRSEAVHNEWLASR